MRRSDYQDALFQQAPIIPISSKSANRKFLEKIPFDKRDMRKCSESLILTNQWDVDFEAAGDIEELQKFFSDLTTTIAVAAYNCGNDHWVLICYREKNDKSVEIWYKDPAARPMPLNVSDLITRPVDNIDVLSHPTPDITEQDLSDFGPVCLANLQKMLTYLGRNCPGNFSDLQFCTEEDVKVERLNRMMKTYLPNLAKNLKFKEALGQFMRNLPLELSGEFDTYIKVLQEEEENNDEGRNMERINNARNKLFNSRNLKKLEEDFTSREHRTHVVGAGPPEFKMKIEEEFPEEMKKLKALLEVIEPFKIDDQLKAKLMQIGEELQIDCDRLMNLYSGMNAEEEEGPLWVPSSEEIAQRLPEGVSPDDPIEEFLQDLGQSGSLMKKIAEHQVEVKSYSLSEVQNWAKSRKSKLKEPEIPRAIAFVNRAICLAHGYFLRPTQVQALLIFLDKEKNLGKLCQIETGEGKTVIVAALAVILALQGHTVDVLTSNPILAADGADKMKNFYNIMNLTVATNNDDGGAAKKGYKADVLYGTINNFQFDFLRETLGDSRVRFCRKFDVVILDEVDSMLVDNGGHIAKISSPFPGMESLRYVYIKIWEELLQLISNSSMKADTIRQQLKPKIEKSLNSAPFTKLIPNHLKKFVASQVDFWIENALKAHFVLREDHHYRLVKDATEEHVIVPVDYSNTGVSMKNTIWSSGLHQFVQLKHHLQLTYENLTSCYISNIAYIGKYEDGKIFGLTGTMGSTAEQELLSQIYHVNYDKVPTFRKKVFEELGGVVFRNGMTLP